MKDGFEIFYEKCINNKEIVDKNTLKKYYNIIEFIDRLSCKMIDVIEDTPI